VKIVDARGAPSQTHGKILELVRKRVKGTNK